MLKKTRSFRSVESKPELAREVMQRLPTAAMPNPSAVAADRKPILTALLPE